MPRGVPAAKPAGTEVALRQCSFGMVLDNYDSFVKICGALAKSGATGERRTEASILAVAMKGAELGLPPMTAIDSIHVIEGKTMLSSSLAQSLVYRDFPGAKFEIEEGPDFCAVRLTVPGREPYLAKYTMKDAELTGKTNKSGSNWQKNPKAMLRARAIAQACRVVAPDCLAGMYCVEEFNETIKVTATVKDSPQAEAMTTAQTEVIDTEVVDEETPAESTQAEAKPAESAKPATTPATTASNGNGHHTNGNSNGNGQKSAAKIETPQASSLKQLKEELLIPADKWLDLLKPFGVNSARDLTKTDADKLISQLRKQKEERVAEPVGAGN